MNYIINMRNNTSAKDRIRSAISTSFQHGDLLTCFIHNYVIELLIHLGFYGCYFPLFNGVYLFEIKSLGFWHIEI